MTTNKKAILYFRVSTDEQADGYSLAHQEERLRTYCDLHGITIVAAFREDHSAKTFERPQFQKLLTLLKKNRAITDLLLFTKWDRFSRNAGDAYSMIHQLKKLQTEPQAIEQPLDLSIPENKMMLAFYLAAPEVENDRRALNTLVGMRRARKEGRWLGTAPKGYRNGKDAQGKPVLVPHEQTAPLVRWAFEEMALGVSDIETVRRAANKKGLIVSRSQFWNLLHNPVYCGRVAIAAYKEESAHCVKGIHEPIISEALFEDVQDVLTGRKRVTKARSTKNEHLPLRGYLLCKCCGRPVTGSGVSGNGGRYYYYNCQTATICKERYKADEAHEAFITLLKTIVAKKEVLELYGAIMRESYKKNGIDKSRQIKELQAQIDKLKQRVQNAQTLMLDAELSAAEYREMRSSLCTEIDVLERRKVALLTSEDDYEHYLDKGMPILQNIYKHWLAADLAGKQRIVGSIFPEKLIYEKKSYRTTEEHPVLALIANGGAVLSGSKKKQAGDDSGLSYRVARTGMESLPPFCGSLEWMAGTQSSIALLLLNGSCCLVTVLSRRVKKRAPHLEGMGHGGLERIADG
jgi:DNA invertase Pin-like site-specific DNA recombinase